MDVGDIHQKNSPYYTRYSILSYERWLPVSLTIGNFNAHRQNYCNFPRPCLSHLSRHGPRPPGVKSNISPGTAKLGLIRQGPQVWNQAWHLGLPSQASPRSPTNAQGRNYDTGPGHCLLKVVLMTMSNRPCQTDCTAMSNWPRVELTGNPRSWYFSI